MSRTDGNRLLSDCGVGNVITHGLCIDILEYYVL